MSEVETARAAELIATCNSRGYRLILEIVDEVLTEVEQDALNCEDENKVIGKQREARAARKFWGRVLQSIIQHRTPGLVRESDDIVTVTME